MSVQAAPSETTRSWAWSSGPCAAVGHGFEVRVEPPEVVRRVARHVANFRAKPQALPAGDPVVYEVRRSDDGPSRYVLLRDGEVAGRAHLIGDLMSSLAWCINRAVIDTSCESRVLLHSAAASCQGVTVMLPAEMECGKTTTVAGLVRRGYSYVTDEAVAIDPASGWIESFPKLMCFDRGSWSLFPEAAPEPDEGTPRQWHVGPADLCGRSAPPRVPPPRLIVFPTYVAGSATSFTPLSPGAAVRAMALTTFRFPEHAGRNLRVLAQVAGGATSGRLVIGDLDSAVNVIDDLVSRRIREDL